MGEQQNDEVIDKYHRVCKKCDQVCGVDNINGQMHWICWCGRPGTPWTPEEVAVLEAGIEAQQHIQDLKLSHTPEQIEIESLQSQIDTLTKRAEYAEHDRDKWMQRCDDASKCCDEATDELEGLREALTASTETKRAYMGEFSINLTEFDDFGDERIRKIDIPWITIKEIMKAIRDRSAAVRERGNVS